MKRVMFIKTATFATCMALFYVAYYLLLRDNFLNLSISSIIAQAHGLEVKTHLLVLALLPFYIAGVIFGTALLGMYLISFAQQYLSRFQNKSAAEKINCLS